MASTLLNPAMFIFFPALMALAASMDLLTMTIPNRICAILAVGYFILALALGVPLSVILVNLTCGLAILALTFAMFSLGWIGGGDAKLAAATALWMGWGAILDYGVTAALCGGLLTLALLAARSLTLPHWLSRHEWIARLHHRKTGVPYGIALAAAGMLQYPHSHIWIAAGAGA
jgi:prepilin peptidase CpaA